MDKPSTESPLLQRLRDMGFNPTSVMERPDQKPDGDWEVVFWDGAERRVLIRKLDKGRGWMFVRELDFDE